jgi:hypothetical protein
MSENKENQGYSRFLVKTLFPLLQVQEVEVPYYKKWPWYKSYEIWCDVDNLSNDSGTFTYNTSNTSFSDIETF